MEKYRTIVADPPWHYDARPIGGAKPGTFGEAEDFPYPTMTLGEIAALPIGELADRDCALWLWTTNAYLPDAFTLVKWWGFSYRQTITWGKNNPMPVGSIAPSAAEFLLFARKGRPSTSIVMPSSVVVTARPPDRRHSTKPECFLDWIEQSSPEPRLEMFSRRARIGWDTWGDQALHGTELVA